MTLAGAIFGSISFKKDLSYKEDLAIGDNSKISYCVSGPSQTQIDEMAAIDSVESITPVYLIERNVSFSKKTTLFYGIDNLKDDSIKRTFFDSILSGDGILTANDAYIDKNFSENYHFGVGDSLSVSFGGYQADLKVRGILTPVNDVLGLQSYSDPHQGIALFRFTTQIAQSFSNKPHISYAPIVKKDGAAANGALETYLSTYKPLGGVWSYDEFKANYESLHSQGSYTNEEWAKIIQDAYNSYYSSAIGNLSTSYETKGLVFRDLYADDSINELHQSASKLNTASLIIAALGFVPLLIVSLLSLKEEKEIVQEGSSLVQLKKKRFIFLVAPSYLLSLLIICIFFFINLSAKGNFAGIGSGDAFMKTGVLGFLLSLALSLLYFILFPLKEKPSKKNEQEKK